MVTMYDAIVLARQVQSDLVRLETYLSDLNLTLEDLNLDELAAAAGLFLEEAGHEH